MTWKIELIPVPVTDVDRAKAFYEKLGFNADHDHKVQEGLRFVQLTPPGSACSIVIGEGITEKEGMEQPIYYWDPSIAPSGFAFYDADLFPGWKGSVLVGALAGKLKVTGDIESTGTAWHAES